MSLQKSQVLITHKSKMYIDKEEQFSKVKQKINFSIKLISVLIKIKFPCRMYLTGEGQLLTKQADLNIRDINHVTQERSIFKFNELIVIQKALNQEEQDIQLTVHLKTAKGSTYQAGLIKIKEQDLILNQGNNMQVKFNLSKSIDPEAFCLIKVQKIEIGHGKNKPRNNSLGVSLDPDRQLQVKDQNGSLDKQNKATINSERPNQAQTQPVSQRNEQQSTRNNNQQQEQETTYKNRQPQLKIKYSQLQKLTEQNKQHKQNQQQLNRHKKDQLKSAVNFTSLQSRLLTSPNQYHQLQQQVYQLKQVNANNCRQLSLSRQQNQQLKWQVEALKQQVESLQSQVGLYKRQVGTLKQQSELNSGHKRSFSALQNKVNSMTAQTKMQVELINIQKMYSSELQYSQMISSSSLPCCIAPSSPQMFNSAFQTPSSLQTHQKHSYSVCEAQTKQQQSYYRHLLRKKNVQIQVILRGTEQLKLNLYKLQKQSKLHKQQLKMNQQQKRRYMAEINQDKARYSRLLLGKNQVEVRNLHLTYDLQQLRQNVQRTQREHYYAIKELQQTIQTNTAQFEKKLALVQQQLKNSQTTSLFLQTTVIQTKKQAEKYRKQQRLSKQQIQKLTRQRQMLIKQKKNLSDQITTKIKQIQNVNKLNQMAKQRSYQLITDAELLKKKQHILQTTIQEGKQVEKELKRDIMARQSITTKLKDQNKKTKLKIKQLASIMIERLSQQQRMSQKANQEFKQWFIKVRNQIPYLIVKKFNAKINQKQLNQKYSFCSNSQNNVTFFKPAQSKKQMFKDQVQSRENEQLVDQNSISSIIQNDGNIDSFYPSKVFGSIGDLNGRQLKIVVPGQSQQDQLEKQQNKINQKHKTNEQNILLNLSLTNLNQQLFNNNMLVENSFGNIINVHNGSINQKKDNEQKQNQNISIGQKSSKVNNNQNILTIERLQFSQQKTFGCNHQRGNIQGINIKLNHSLSSKWLKQQQKYFQEDQKSKSYSNLRSINTNQKTSSKNVIPPLMAIRQKKQQNQRLSRQKNKNDQFLQYLYYCVNMASQQQAYRQFLEQDFNILAYNHDMNQYSRSSLHISNDNQQHPTIRQSKILASSVMVNSDNQQGPAISSPMINIPRYLVQVQAYFNLFYQQIQQLQYNVQQQSTIICQNQEIIFRLQRQLENQQMQFNEWIHKMQYNLEERTTQRQSQTLKLRKQYNSVLKRLHSKQNQLQISYIQQSKLQRKLTTCKNQQEQLQQQVNKLQQELAQQKSQVNQTNYQVCLKQQQFSKQKKVLTQKLTLSNTHMLILQTQAFKLEQQLIRVRQEYQSMLDYSQQEKEFLKEKITNMQQSLSDQKQKRMRAEKLDNFEQANQLFDQNQRLRGQITKLQRQCQFKQVSASVIMEQKEQENERWKEMIRSVPLQDLHRQSRLSNHQHSNKLKQDGHIAHYFVKQQIMQSLGQCEQFVKQQIMQSLGQCEQFVGETNFENQHVFKINHFLGQLRAKPKIHSEYQLGTSLLRLPGGSKLSFQASNPKQVDSIDSQRGQVSQILNKTKPKSQKQEQYSESQQQLKLKQERQAQGLNQQVLRIKKLISIQSIQVDLQTYERQYTSHPQGQNKKELKQYLFIHCQQKNEIQDGVGQGHCWPSKKIPHSCPLIIPSFQAQQIQMIQNIKRNPIQPSPIIAYSKRHQSLFVGNQNVARFTSEPIFQRKAYKHETQKSFVEDKKDYQQFTIGFALKNVDQMEQYEHINLVNFEGQMQIQEYQSIPKSPSKGQDQDKPGLDTNFQAFENKPFLQLRIVRSLNFSHQQNLHQFPDQIDQAKDQKQQFTSQFQKMFQ